MRTNARSVTARSLVGGMFKDIAGSLTTEDRKKIQELVRDTVAKVCGVDLSEEITPDGAAFRSSVAKLVTDVVRDDRGTERSYLLHCERSSGQYLFDALIDAGDEFGIEVEGFVAPEMRGVSG